MRKNASLLSRPKLKAQHSKNVFDLSFKNVFSAPLGALIPCGTWLLNPRDKIRISNESQVVVPELVRPTFMRLKQHIDYFVVPLSSLWSPFDQFITQQTDQYSAAVATAQKDSSEIADFSIPKSVPCFNPDFLYHLFTNNQGSSDILGYDINRGMVRLLDMLGYGNLNLIMSDLESADPSSQFVENGDLNYNFFNICAYQKIYFDYYRNNQYEAFSPYYCNIDDLRDRTYDGQDYEAQLSSDYSPARFDQMFRLRYRWSKKDYFMNVQPSVLPTSNMLGFEGINEAFEANSNVDHEDFFHLFGVPGIDFSEPQSAPSNANFDGSRTSSYQGANIRMSVARGLTIPQLRLAFAYDRYYRRIRVAGQDYRKQMLAIFGAAPTDEKHGRAFRIGGFVNRISPQTQTATTAENLGKIGGLIDTYNNNSKYLTYEANNHCIVMAICSFSVDNDYSSNSVMRENVMRYNLDYFNPIFENLGLEWLFGMELRLFDNVESHGIFTSDYLTSVIGLVPRYYQYKIHRDEIHGRYTSEEDFSDFKGWVTEFPYYDYRGSGGKLAAAQMIENPRKLDNMLSVMYDGTQGTDQFTINMYHKVQKISAMSVYGEDF